jgi:hypothetical protein
MQRSYQKGYFPSMFYTRLRSLDVKNKTLRTKRTEKRKRHTMGPKGSHHPKNGKLTIGKETSSVLS